MFKKVGMVLCSAALVASLAACSDKKDTVKEVQAAGGDKPQIELKLGHGAATDNPRHIAALKFAELVSQKTNGKVKVNVFPSEILGSDQQMEDAVKLGTLDGALISTGVVATIAPKMQAINLPYMFKDYNSAYKVLDGELGKEMGAQLEDKNIHLINYWENGFRVMTNSKHPINNPADLAGLKMRVPDSPISIATFKALGTNPTPLAFGQLYTALQSKVVDGQENPLTNVYASKFYEVQKYLSVTNHQYSALPFIINKAKWNSLQPDIQKAIIEAAGEARDLHRQLVQKDDKDLIQKLKDNGMNINTPDPSPFRQAAHKVYSDNEATIGADFLNKVIKATE
jgi:tripartite ATP-independent transporter DctP family solute receptor